MQKGILKLTKRPSVKALSLFFFFFFFSLRTSSAVLETIFRGTTDYFPFDEPFSVRFLTWHVVPLFFFPLSPNGCSLFSGSVTYAVIFMPSVE